MEYGMEDFGYSEGAGGRGREKRHPSNIKQFVLIAQEIV